MNTYDTDLPNKLRQLMWLSRRVGQVSRGEHGPFADTSRGQGRVLAALKLQPEISTRDLAYLLGLRPQSLNEVLKRLESKDLITREPSEADRRVIVVRITEKGEAQAPKRSDPTGILDVLTEEEQATFNDYLDRLIEALEDKLGATSDEEFERMAEARDRFGIEFDELMMMRRGGHPGRRMPPPDFPRGGGRPRRGGRRGQAPQR
jgi:DNA-binding MarR family transcriptional regulator